jgi:hypothetical protein
VERPCDFDPVALQFVFQLPSPCVEPKGADGSADVFDGAMVALAMFMLSLSHPGVLLHGPDKLESESDVDHVKEQDSPSP